MTASATIVTGVEMRGGRVFGGRVRRRLKERLILVGGKEPKGIKQRRIKVREREIWGRKKEMMSSCACGVCGVIRTTPREMRQGIWTRDGDGR